jgi:hypothetical protein
MTWPTWINEIAARYLANEASVFLLHGAVVGEHWSVEGKRVDCVGMLEAFLGRTKPIVGVIWPSEGLSFSGMGDEGHFERLVGAAELMDVRTRPLSNHPPQEALGRVWLALSSSGVDQGYIIGDLHALLPRHRKRVEALGAEAPPLWAWCDHPRVRQSNNILCLLTPALSEVHGAVVEAATAVQVEVPVYPASSEPEAPSAPPPPPGSPPHEDAEAEIAAFLAKRSNAEAENAPTTDGGTALADALRETLGLHPVSSWAQRLPVIDALARVLAERVPGQVGAITWSVEEGGAVTGTGRGADWVLERWHSDIALDAAAGMLLGDLEVPEGATHLDAPEGLSATALKALNRRLEKVIRTV